MPRFPSEEDLFKESTMTFGQHLEELRVCLFKAIVGLALGMGIGLLLGGPVVKIIQRPLQRALEEYYHKQAVKTVDSRLEQLRNEGYTMPGGEERVRTLLARPGYTFDVVYVDPEELPWQMKESQPAAVLESPKAESEDNAARLMPILLGRRSADDPRLQVKSLNAQEPFMIYLKASLLVGIIIASPWIFYQIWSFVAAGLYPHEKRYVHLFLPFSVALFLAGASLAFFFVFEPVLRFLFGFNSMLGIAPEPRINEWMGFVLLLPLGFGVSFQLPLVMLFMERIGVFTVQAYLKSWRVAILAIFVLAMILTPSGDPYSMCLMALPLCVLYLGGIALCHYLPRQPRAFAD
jgi:sec-independent protein translocase protein TatC